MKENEMMKMRNRLRAEYSDDVAWWMNKLRAAEGIREKNGRYGELALQYDGKVIASVLRTGIDGHKCA